MMVDQIREHLKLSGWEDKEITAPVIRYMQWLAMKAAELTAAYKSAEDNIAWSRNLSDV
jgi:hypothetical protein